MLARHVLVVGIVALLAGGFGAASSWESAPSEIARGSSSAGADFVTDVELPALERPVIRFDANAPQPLEFTLTVEQQRPDSRYYHGSGIIFFAALVVQDGEVVAHEVNQYYLGDADIAAVYALDRSSQVPLRPFATNGGTEGFLRGSLPAGESSLVVTAWGATGSMRLNVTGGGPYMSGPMIEAASTPVHQSEIAQFGFSTEAWVVSAQGFVGTAQIQIHPGDVLLWMGELRQDHAKPLTGGLTCTRESGPCATLQYSSDWGNATITTRGTLAHDEQDWVIAAILPTNLEPSYTYPQSM